MCIIKTIKWGVGLENESVWGWICRWYLREDKEKGSEPCKYLEKDASDRMSKW